MAEPTGDDSKLHQLRQWQAKISGMASSAPRGSREVLTQRAALLGWAIRRIEGVTGEPEPDDAELAKPCPAVLEVDLSGRWRAEVSDA